jgi:hypothetical protein
MVVMGAAAHAQVHSSDIVLRVAGGTSGPIETGGVDQATGVPYWPQRVFAATLGDFNFTNDPGFDSFAGAFSPAVQVGFDVLAALHAWDGLDFDQIADAVMRIKFGTFERFTPAADEVVAGFGISPAANGEYHRHLGYTLMDPAGDGVYLLQMRMWSAAPGVLNSKPFFIVFGQNAAPAQQDAALEWTYLRYICPADLGKSGGLPGHDGLLDNNDFIVFIDRFFAADAIADMGAAGGEAGGDGLFDNNDFIVFIDRFFGGCT